VAVNLAGERQDLPIAGGAVVLATGDAVPGDSTLTLDPSTAAVVRL
jgi:hypothetical protein